MTALNRIKGKILNYEKARKSAIWLLRLEAGILAAIFLFLVYESFTSTVTVWSALIAEMSFSLIGALGMFFASTSYVKEKSFGRSPAVAANLIALGVSYYMISGKFLIAGIPLALLAIATIISAVAGFRDNY